MGGVVSIMSRSTDALEFPSATLPPRPTPGPITVYIAAAVLTAVATITAVVIVSVKVKDSAGTITTIVGVGMPLILGLIGAGLQGVHQIVNGNLTSVRNQLSDALDRVERLQTHAVNVAESRTSAATAALAAAQSVPAAVVIAGIDPSVVVPAKVTDVAAGVVVPVTNVKKD